MSERASEDRRQQRREAPESPVEVAKFRLIVDSMNVGSKNGVVRGSRLTQMGASEPQSKQGSLGIWVTNLRPGP